MINAQISNKTGCRRIEGHKDEIVIPPIDENLKKLKTQIEKKFLILPFLPFNYLTFTPFNQSACLEQS